MQPITRRYLSQGNISRMPLGIRVRVQAAKSQRRRRASHPPISMYLVAGAESTPPWMREQIEKFREADSVHKVSGRTKQMCQLTPPRRALTLIRASCRGRATTASHHDGKEPTMNHFAAASTNSIIPSPAAISMRSPDEIIGRRG